MTAREYRIVAEVGVAPAAELQRDLEAALKRQREQYGAASSTVEAVMHQLRADGIAALRVPNCQRRLSELSTKQVREAIERLMRLRPQYPAITDELLLRLGEQLS